MWSSVFPSEKGRARPEVPETLGRGQWLQLRGRAGIRLPFGAPSVSPSGRCKRSGHSCLERGAATTRSARLPSRTEVPGGRGPVVFTVITPRVCSRVGPIVGARETCSEEGKQAQVLAAPLGS